MKAEKWAVVMVDSMDDPQVAVMAVTMVVRSVERMVVVSEICSDVTKVVQKAVDWVDWTVVSMVEKMVAWKEPLLVDWKVASLEVGKAVP